MNNSSHVIVRVARDCDLLEQRQRDMSDLDLVDYSKVRAFHVLETYRFSQFKEDIAAEFGIPVQCQRFWKWRKRPNHTYRPDTPLTPEEESKPVGELTKVRDWMKSELKLFLEVELGLDDRHVPLPVKSDEDIMLFFKLYDPAKTETRYVGRLFVKNHAKPSETLRKINEMAGFSPYEEVDLYRELQLKYDKERQLNPVITSGPIDGALSFQENELGDGDIIYFQKTKDHRAKSSQYATFASLLEQLRVWEETESDLLPSVRFIWKISNFSKLTLDEYDSDGFPVGGFKCGLVLRRKGDIANHLTIGLYADADESLPNGWSRTVDFSLTVVNQHSRDSSIKKGMSKEFNASNSEVVFPSFMRLTELHDQAKGYLVQDTMVVEADVVLLKAVPPVFSANFSRVKARFESFFDTLGELFDEAETSACVKGPSSATHQTSDAVPICLNLEEVESAKQFLKECLGNQFEMNLKERLASALSTLSAAQSGLSREQRKSILEFWGHFDEFISDHLTLEQENSEYELHKVQNDVLFSTMKRNHGTHLSYKQLFEKLDREDGELYKSLRETRGRETKLISDWGALRAKTEEIKSDYVSRKPKLAEAEDRKRIAEESTSRSTTAWSSLKTLFL